MKSFGLNLLVAVIWLLLSQEPSPAVFALGFGLGFLLVAAFRPVIGNDSYVRRCVALGRFLLLFTREFLVANAKVAWTVLFRSRESLHPNFIVYDTRGLNPAEILLLSYCLSLTPGTTTVDIAPDFRSVVIHALDADDPAAIRREIDSTLRRGILAFTR